MFEHLYPYTSFHELNLDWIIGIVKAMEKKLENFVATNSIKYANPFQWSIVNQYEKNTLVIEPNTGTAYLSVQAVPQGVNISNTDYWTPVFDLSTLFVDINRNFTGNDEQLNVYSSANYSIGDWLLWKNKLYRVISPIVTGNAFDVDTNIQQITIEEVVSDMDTFINASVNAINANIGDLDDLATSDKSNLVNAINETLVSSVFNSPQKYGAVGDGVADDTAAVQDAINAGNTYIPKGRYRITSALKLPSFATVRGDGEDSIITCDGCNGFEIDPEWGANIYNLIINNANPTYKAIVVNGTGPAPDAVNRIRIVNVTTAGFNIAVDIRYGWNVSIANCKFISPNIGVQLFGQSVNNEIVNTEINTLSGSTSHGDGIGNVCINIIADNGVRSEGLNVTNSILTGAYNAIYSQGILSINVSNCTIDLIKNDCFFGYFISSNFIGNWIYSTERCFNIPAIGVAQDNDLNISNNRMTSVNSAGVFIGSNNFGLNIIGNVMYVNGAAIYLDGLASRVNAIGNDIVQTTPGSTSIYVDYGADNKIAFNRSNGTALMVQLANMTANTVFANTNATHTQKIISGIYSAKPASGTWNKGDMIIFEDPTYSNYAGAVCIASGTPGTWKYFGALEA